MKTDFYKSIAILCSGLMMTALAACSDNDEMIVETHQDNVDIPVPTPEQQVTDDMSVTISGSTYVFGGDYTAEGKALVNRVNNTAGSLKDTGVENIIIHNGRIPSLTDNETTDLLQQMAGGAALVVAEPTVDNMKVLTDKLHGVINKYSIDANESSSKVNQILQSQILHRIKSWKNGSLDSYFHNLQSQGRTLALLAIRDEDSYEVSREPQGETDNATVQICDENHKVAKETTVSYVDDAEMSDFHYGIKTDNLARWLNTPDGDPVARENSRRVAARLMANQTGDRAEEYLDKITESIEHTLSAGFQVSGPQGHNPYHECEVKYRVWTAYSSEKKCDVYCVTMDITAYNQMLKCGPTKETDWYSGADWAAWKALDKNVYCLASRVYGPYMNKLSSECWLNDNNMPVTLEEYAPQNSTTGGQNVTNGFSYSIGASASAKASGPEASVSTSMQWSHSVSRFNADLKMAVTATPEGKVTWTYTGSDPDSHYRPFSNYHETAKSILTSTCTLQHAWVWTVKGSTSSSVTIISTVSLQDRWLTYQIGRLECIPHYISQASTSNALFEIPCPPRHLQAWSMNVESDDVSADKLKEIEAFLTAHFCQYFMPSCVFSTVKAEHKRATSVTDCDEVSTYVNQCKEAYTSTSGRELLREAGKRAGIPDTGSFRIVWRHTDLGVNSDREEFTFNMNMQ